MRHGLLFWAALATALCGQEPQEIDYTEIPVNMIEVKVPVVDLPQVNPPDIKIGRTNAVYMKYGPLGSYPLSFYVASESVTERKIAELAQDIPLITVNCDRNLLVNMSEGRISLVDVDTGNALPSKVEIVAVEDGKLNLIDIDTGKVLANDIKASTVEIRNIAVPSVYSADERIKAWQNFMEMARTRFKDQRMVANDKGMTPFSESLKEWLEIYRTHGDYEMAYVPLPDGIRMVAEARVPKNAAQWAMLCENLAFYAAQGYTSVLLAVTGGDSRDDLLETITAIKSRGLKVWFALSGKETLTDTLFISPSRIRECFAVVAPASEGMLLGWRRTSVHLFDMDLEYASFLVKTARAYNPSLAVLGEGYYGATANSNERTTLTYNMPKNVSGCEVIGVGYANVNPGMALNSLYNAMRNIAKVAVVLGDRPYYATRNPNGLDFLENLLVKQRIERRFMEAGCKGTITMHGDGSDGVYGEAVSDNLSQSEHR